MQCSALGFEAGSRLICRRRRTSSNRSCLPWKSRFHLPTPPWWAIQTLPSSRSLRSWLFDLGVCVCGVCVCYRSRWGEIMVRAMYCEMLGYDASFTYIHAIKLAQQGGVLEKRVGTFTPHLHSSPDITSITHAQNAFYRLQNQSQWWIHRDLIWSSSSLSGMTWRSRTNWDGLNCVNVSSMHQETCLQSSLKNSAPVHRGQKLL